MLRSDSGVDFDAASASNTQPPPRPRSPHSDPSAYNLEFTHLAASFILFHQALQHLVRRCDQPLACSACTRFTSTLAAGGDLSRAGHYSRCRLGCWIRILKTYPQRFQYSHFLYRMRVRLSIARG